MASHHQHLTLVSTHRATIVPDEWAAEHAQVEEYEPRVYSARDMGFAFFLGGLFFSLIFAAMAWIIAGMPS